MIASAAVVCPVPPLAIGSVPVIPDARETLVMVLLEPLIVLLVRVSVVSVPTRVVVALGRLTVLSALGSAATRVVS